MSDLVLNVRQIMQYPLRSPVSPADALLLQTGGLGGAYAYATVAGVTGATRDNDVGRNLLHNARFNVQQRGAGMFTASNAFTADRWRLTYSVDVGVAVNLLAASDAARAQVGDEAFQSYALVSFTGAGGFTGLTQAVEGVRRLGGKTVTVSFWALGAGLNLGVSLDQFFGSGGGSARVEGNGLAVALTGLWARYSVTLTLASTAGMTLGPNADDCTFLNFWFSAGTPYAANAGNIGVQAGTIGLSGVQLEIGPAATTLETLDPQQDWAKCLRFYQGNIGPLYLTGYSPIAGITVGAFYPLLSLTRSAPAVTAATNSNSNLSTLTISADVSGIELLADAVGVGIYVWNMTFNVSADL